MKPEDILDQAYVFAVREDILCAMENTELSMRQAYALLATETPLAQVYPEIFGEQLLQWLRRNDVKPRNAMDLACGTGILCDILHKSGIQASGMDFSAGMIEIARQGSPEIHYDVADMITYCPEQQFDLVTCTGDAINHIANLMDVEKISRTSTPIPAPAATSFSTFSTKTRYPPVNPSKWIFPTPFESGSR